MKLATALVASTLLWPFAIFAQTGLPKAHAREVLISTTHQAMGTEFELHLYSADRERAASISDEVFDEIDRLDQLLSNYKDTSELTRINRHAAQGPVTTDAEMFSFLEQAGHWTAVSHGAFDITVGALMRTWGFLEHQGRVPSSQELEALRSTTGWQKVQLNSADRTVRFLADGVELDPGGIGKGFAVDSAVRILRRAHVTAAMISAGGSTIYGLGAPPQQAGWRVVIRGPLPSRATLSTVFLRDTSLSSSDCTQKHFVEHGQMYCHIMNPRTMQPVRDRVQVSIIDPSATASDALSNVLFVESPMSSLATLKAFAPDSRALIVSKEGGEVRCAQFRCPSSLRPSACTSR